MPQRRTGLLIRAMIVVQTVGPSTTTHRCQQCCVQVCVVLLYRFAAPIDGNTAFTSPSCRSSLWSTLIDLPCTYTRTTEAPATHGIQKPQVKDRRPADPPRGGAAEPRHSCRQRPNIHLQVRCTMLVATLQPLHCLLTAACRCTIRLPHTTYPNVYPAATACWPAVHTPVGYVQPRRNKPKEAVQGAA